MGKKNFKILLKNKFNGDSLSKEFAVAGRTNKFAVVAFVCLHDGIGGS
jgi:hypothetical protein